MTIEIMYQMYIQERGHGMTSSSAIVINIEVIDKGVKIEKEKRK